VLGWGVIAGLALRARRRRTARGARGAEP
jgi:hypothetical protein